VGLALGGASAVGYRATSSGSRATGPVAAPRVVDEVRSALSARYYRQVPDSVLGLGSVRQIISALGDPYTEYLGPSQYRLLRHETEQRYSGIGASVEPTPQGLVVIQVPAGPARQAGIAPGDTIVRVGGVSLGSLGVARAAANILGAPGSRVRLQLERAGKRIEVRVRRALIDAPNVRSRLVSYAGERFGVLRLSAFGSGSTASLRREIARLEGQGAVGLVLDLRQNPGGLLVQAVRVASLFVHRGVIVSLQGLHQPQEVLRAIPGPLTTRLPLAVLVDRFTASSAEVVAGALRDHRRATIVGEPTYGKALVQAVDPLGHGAALELSIAHYSTPSGDDLSGRGLTPQIRAVDDPHTRVDEGLVAALHVLARPTS
jgi:carboxyl-terminal processing protease